MGECLSTSAEQGGEGRAGGLGGAELGEERVIESSGVDIFGHEQGGAIGDAHHPDGHALSAARASESVIAESIRRTRGHGEGEEQYLNGVEGTAGDDVAEEVAADAAAAEEHHGENRLHRRRHLRNLDSFERKAGST